MEKSKMIRNSLISFLAAIVLVLAYTLSIIWRVSLAEVEQFGYSILLPMKSSAPLESGPCGPETFFNASVFHERSGKKVLVWSDKINCFQHVYGSALSAYEIGEVPAKILFNLNELAEYTFDHNGVSRSDLLDRRKDLAHNAVGRRIAKTAKRRGLRKDEAEKYMQILVLDEMATSKKVFLSYLDPRIPSLPSETEQGCYFLPRKNLFNLLGFSKEI